MASISPSSGMASLYSTTTDPAHQPGAGSSASTYRPTYAL